jgi:hypothetical protein
MIRFFLLLLLMVSTKAFGQGPAIEWQKCFGGSDFENAFVVAATNDSGSVVVGTTHSTDGDLNSLDNDGILVAKFSLAGAVEWHKTLNVLGNWTVARILATQDGGYILIGHTSSSSYFQCMSNSGINVWAMRLNSVGDIIWKYCYGGSADEVTNMGTHDMSVIEVPGLGFLVGCSTYSNDGQVSGNHGLSDYCLFKIDYDGILTWQKCFGGSGFDSFKSLIKTNDGYLLIGASGSNDGDVSYNHQFIDINGQLSNSLDLWVVKIDTGGNIIWEKSYGGNGDDSFAGAEGNCSAPVSGNKYVIGLSTTTINNGDVWGIHAHDDVSMIEDYDAWVVLIDSSGNLIWQKCIGTLEFDLIYDLVVAQDSLIYLLHGNGGVVNGDLCQSIGMVDFSILRLDVNGQIIWKDVYGGTLEDDYRMLTLDRLGRVFMFGLTTSNDVDVSGLHGSTDIWFARLASDTFTVPLIAITPTVIDTANCACQAEASVQVNNGVSPFSYLWSNGATTQMIFGVCPGAYTVTVYDAAGNCTNDTAFVSLNSSQCTTPTVSVLNVQSSVGTVTWSWNTCATKYRVRVKNMSTGLVSLYIVTAPDTFKLLNNLTANTTYQVKVRSQCSSNGSVLSPWSNTVTFTTPGASNCIYPDNVTATPTSNTSSTINWTPVTNAAGYQLRYKETSATSWNLAIINSGTASTYNLTNLQPNTTYKYQLRTKCSVNPLTWSSFSPIQTFATPLRIEESDQLESVRLYPNPSTGHATFDANGFVGVLSVYDAVGKLVRAENVSRIVDLTDLPIGLVTWRFVSSNGSVRVGTLVVVRN